MNSQTVAQLEAFVADPNLKELEQFLSAFNIFSVLSITKKEIMHSNFLAWLFDPNESHALGDTFLVTFLKDILSGSDSNLNALDIHVKYFGDSEVRREYQNTDLLIVNDTLRIVVCIENKIQSRESIGQLQSYRRMVEDEYPNYERVFVYLTLEGDEPSDKTYIPVSYSQIISTLGTVFNKKKSALNSRVASAIEQYMDALERIMPESEIQQLCEALYRKHKEAINLIKESISDHRDGVRDYLVGYIEDNPNLILDVPNPPKSSIKFLPSQFDDLYEKSGEGTSGRILLAEFVSRSNSLNINLTIGPGDADVRQRIYEKVKLHQAQNESSPFTASGRLAERYSRIYSQTLLTETELETNELPDLINLLTPKMPKVSDDLSTILATLSET